MIENPRKPTNDEEIDKENEEVLSQYLGIPWKWALQLSRMNNPLGDLWKRRLLSLRIQEKPKQKDD